MEKVPPGGLSPALDSPSIRRVRTAVVLPDGTRKEPMGSGFITGILGAGGMANVYEIWNPQLEMNRAVKLLHPNYTEESKQRFQTEIKITGKLNHPNIIEIHAVGQWNGLPYIEMERINGKTLETIIEERGALPIEICTSIGIMIGRALKYAHNQEYVIYGKTYHGVIHRDLKPSNIMADINGVVKLMDFGIARPIDASIHTTDGSIMGTMQYLSPEQLDGKDPDVRTDIYSLGTILYEMLTGVKAFPEINVSKLMLSKVKNDYKGIDKFDVKIPPKLRKLIQKCMQHDRERRIQDANAFLSEMIKIHLSITKHEPEYLMHQFMTSDTTSRVVVNHRKIFPVSLIVAGSAFIATVYGIFIIAPKLLTAAGQENKIPVEPPQMTEAANPIGASPAGSVNNADVQRKVEQTKSVQPVKTPAPDHKKAGLDDQIKFYGTPDLLTIFVKEVQNDHFSDALAIYKHLSPRDAATDKAILFKIRALKRLNLKMQYKDLILSSDIRDAEFYLEKAKYFMTVGNLNQAREYLNLSSHTRASFLDRRNLRIERIYQTAKCGSMAFDANPNSGTKNAALEGWFEVKSELQDTKNHKYYKEADSEMRRIWHKKS